ncbi:DJ-1/PfpI family protein [Leptospira sarikeiensis]|uniref:Transcriptional regulator n=1 Tax=Leptospira sarikeiensis TaxID=2484943 RepID=A0A4R9K9U6_9LEPT|nr:DJ-1/PfpI family protein [Leptospira sarikeiensis]TGL63434.1 transcriptional regulator [Leptospira sarikeiensis]
MKQNFSLPDPFWKRSLLSILLFVLFGCTECTSTTEIQNANLSDEHSRIPKYVSRFGRKQPIIAVIGENRFTELTDFMIPYGVLSSAKIAKIIPVFPKLGLVKMFPALQIEAENSFDSFDSEYPEGADYVIVPAVHHSDDPRLISWVQKQSSKGATLVGICDGVWVLANSGILQGHKATGHWFSFSNLEKDFPETKWIRNRRYIADRNIITTTGITASIPASLALIEAISGIEKAKTVASSLGAKQWNADHQSSDFYLSRTHMYTASKNYLLFWRHEKLGVRIFTGVDEISLALQADSYSRTYKTDVFAVSNGKQKFRSKSGLLIHSDLEETDPSLDSILESQNGLLPITSIDQNLREISSKYGKETAAFVALQMEYPWLR